MATLVGSLFDDYSELNANERQNAVSLLGASLEYDNFFGPGNNLNGTSNNDVYFVNNRNTVITDQGGNDIVISSANYKLGNGIESLILTGSDDLRGEGNNLNNFIAGNDGDNRLDGNGGSDIIFAGAGDDRVEGDTGRDTIYGGSGDDRIDAGSDSDLVYGGSGDDRIEGDSGRDTIHGDGGDDRIDAGNDSDLVYGGAGNDRIEGDSGRDTIYGDAGDDYIDGGRDSDSLDGGRGNDRIIADSGNDTLVGGRGDDSLWGGAGSDTFIFEGTSGSDVIFDFEAGKDKIVINTGGVDTFADLFNDSINNVISEVNGHAVIDLGNGNTISLNGVDVDDLDANDFIII